MSEAQNAYEAKARRDYELQTMKVPQKGEAIEPRHAPSTIGVALEVLGQRITDCEKGAAVLEETLTPCLSIPHAEGAVLNAQGNGPSSPLLIHLLGIIDRVEGLEFKLRTTCNRVEL